MILQQQKLYIIINTIFKPKAIQSQLQSAKRLNQTFIGPSTNPKFIIDHIVLQQIRRQQRYRYDQNCQNSPSNDTWTEQKAQITLKQRKQYVSQYFYLLLNGKMITFRPSKLLTGINKDQIDSLYTQIVNKSPKYLAGWTFYEQLINNITQICQAHILNKTHQKTVFGIKLGERKAMDPKITQSCIISGKKCSLQIFYIGPSFRLVRKLNKKTSKLSTKDANVFQACDVHQSQNMQKNALLIDKCMFSSENLQKQVDFLSKLQECKGLKAQLKQKTVLRLYQMFECPSITSMCFWSQNLIKCQLFRKKIHLSFMQKVKYLYIQPKLPGTDTWRKIEPFYWPFIEKEGADQSKNQLLGVRNQNFKPKPPKLESNNKQYLWEVNCLRKCRGNSSQYAYSAGNISRLCFLPTHNNMATYRKKRSSLRKYGLYSRKKRLEFIRLVQVEQRSVTSAARQLGIPQRTASLMMRVWLTENRVFQAKEDQEKRLAKEKRKRQAAKQRQKQKEIKEANKKARGQKHTQEQVAQVKVESPVPAIKEEQNPGYLPIANPEPTLAQGTWMYYHPCGIIVPPMPHYPWMGG